MDAAERARLRAFYEANGGILRLLPVFIPFTFNKPGGRLRLHPDDYYAFGLKRGAIKERWFASVPPGNGTEGASPVDIPDKPASLGDFVRALGAELIGEPLMSRYGTWPVYAKFFDYGDALFHHVHLDFKNAAAVGRIGKPEAYYFPPQLNDHPGSFPHTYIGFDPAVTKEQVKARLADFERRDTRITELSRAYRLQLGTGWYMPPGVLHAPGSYLTYETQWNGNAGAVFENVVSGEVMPKGHLVSSCPEERRDDMDYVIGLLDWDKNTDPDFRAKYFRPPLPAGEGDGYAEKWITYGNPYIAAKELTVLPERKVTVADEAAYGCILIQGHGRLGGYEAETPGMIRFGQKSADEYFIGEPAARRGVTIQNGSSFEPLVILKHFADNLKRVP